MPKESIRVVIRQPLHGLLKEWSELLGVDDFGEVVNYLLLDLKRSGYLPNSQPVTAASNLPKSLQQTESTLEVNDLAGLF